jgi:ABC-type branched-subunit amino acid transport system ATPase component
VTPVLEARGLVRRFGAVRAVDGIDFRLPAGARHALIGPNGAGKTTFIDLLTGELRPDAGEVRLSGLPVTGLAPHARVRRGLARTFQVNRLFPGLTPLEAVMLVLLEREGRSRRFLSSLARRGESVEEACAVLARVGLEEDALRPTRELAYGRQRLLEIALALACAPKVLLLDEPAAGVPRGEGAEILEALVALPKDVSLLFIEHDMDIVFRFAERVTVLAAGRVLAEGTPAEVGADAQVRAVYLGQIGHG